MAKEIRYLKAAQQDLRDIFDYVRRDNPDAAVDLLTSFDEGIQQLAAFSSLGKIPADTYLRQKGYRVLTVSRYLVFYIDKSSFVQIHRILHNRRNYRDLF